MILVEQHIIKKNHQNFDELYNFCCLSKNLYNSAIYTIRRNFEETEKYLNYYEVNKKFVTEKQIDYYRLPSKVAQNTLMLVERSYKSFFELLKLKNSGKYKEQVNIPNYKKSVFPCYFNSQAISGKELKNGFIKLSGIRNFRLRTDKTNIKEVRLIPKGNHITVEICYNHEIPNTLKNNNRIASIDLGLNNLAVLTTNTNSKPIIFNGRPLKSINQYYNKRRVEYQSDLGKTKNGKPRYISKKIRNLTLKRNNKIKDYLHKSSCVIVNQLVSNQINTLVVGYNKGWKQEQNHGSKNNQNFQQIPFYQFKQMLNYKCQLVGINIIFREESYTSKCSFFDNETVKKHRTYLGKRITRGRFKTSSGCIINADVNGSLNILRKEFPDAFTESHGIEGLSLNPLKINIV